MWRLKCKVIIGIGMNSFVLYREVSLFIIGGSTVYPNTYYYDIFVF